MSQDFTIAIVEDHESLREMMVNHFKKENFKVFGGSMAEELDEYFKKKCSAPSNFGRQPARRRWFEHCKAL